MPPRLVTAAIVVGWIATTAWLFHKELWPRLRTEDPPPFTVYGADQVIYPQNFVTWKVSLDGKPIYSARTSVRYLEDRDMFEYSSTVELNGEARIWADKRQPSSLKSLYRITRGGDIREMRPFVQFPHSFQEKGMIEEYVGVHFDASGENGRLEQRSWGMIADRRGHAVRFKNEPEPLEVSPPIGFLNPWHPFSRVKGLSEGQHWRPLLHNPLRDARFIAQQLGSTSSQMLLANVIADSGMDDWNQEHVPCLVIECLGEKAGIRIRVWVSKEDGRVLRQESELPGEHWVFEREHE